MPYHPVKFQINWHKHLQVRVRKRNFKMVPGFELIRGRVFELESGNQNIDGVMTLIVRWLFIDKIKRIMFNF